MIVPFPLTGLRPAALHQRPRKRYESDPALRRAPLRNHLVPGIHAPQCAAAGLEKQGIGFWGPYRTRNGLFHGIQPGPGAGVNGRNLVQRAQGRLKIQMADSSGQGTQPAAGERGKHDRLGPRQNLRHRRSLRRCGRTYGTDVSQAFGGAVTDVALSIRSLDSYWTSALAYAVARGHKLPSAATLDRLAQSPRSWRDVITDIACRDARM